jgi:hypothetical protein
MTPNGFPSDVCKIAKLAGTAAAGTSTLVSGIIDTLGFRKLRLITEMPTDAANNNITVQQGNSVTGGSNADGVITGATALATNVATSQIDAANNGDLLVLELTPTSRYYQVTQVRGTSTLGAPVIAELFDPTDLPVRQPANVILERIANPVAGAV